MRGVTAEIEEVAAMTMPTTEANPYPALIEWLTQHGVDFELREHPVAYTAAGTAFAEGVEPETFAKVVGLRASDGRRMLAVLDATDQVDLGALRELIGVEWVALLSEDEYGALAPDCEVGAAPPIPALVHVPVYVDEGVRADARISFAAGSHRYSVRVDRAAWEQAAELAYAAFGVRRRSLRSVRERGWT
jgi:prolyl-tRNA editing enzyme YbaK/EbsC (Cys-tRNA(Pro) deacylase)